MKIIMKNWRNFVQESGNPDWNGMSIGLLGDGKFVVISADGQALKIFDSRPDAVKYIQSQLQ